MSKVSFLHELLLILCLWLRKVLQNVSSYRYVREHLQTGQICIQLLKLFQDVSTLVQPNQKAMRALVWVNIVLLFYENMVGISKAIIFLDLFGVFIIVS